MKWVSNELLNQSFGGLRDSLCCKGNGVFMVCAVPDDHGFKRQQGQCFSIATANSLNNIHVSMKLGRNGNIIIIFGVKKITLATRDECPC